MIHDGSEYTLPAIRIMLPRLTVALSSRYAARARAGKALSALRSSAIRSQRAALRSPTNASTHVRYASMLPKSRLPRRRRR